MAKQRRRNGHAFHPIMRKGGPHGKSKSALRSAAKRETKRQVQERPGEHYGDAVASRSLLLAALR